MKADENRAEPLARGDSPESEWVPENEVIPLFRWSARVLGLIVAGFSLFMCEVRNRNSLARVEDYPHAASPGPAAGRCRSAWLTDILGTSRPLSSIIVGVLTASATTSGHARLSVRAVGAGFCMTALAMFGFTINDIFDCQKDRVAGIRRPIAAGTLPTRYAVWLAIAFLFFTSLVSGMVGAGGTVLTITAVGLFLYTPVAQIFPPGKDAYVAALCCSPLYYGACLGDRHYSWFSYAVLACFVFGREVLMDADELRGDSKAGIRTIAAIVGPRRTTHIGIGLMLMSAAALVALTRGCATVLAAIATLASVAFVFAWPGLDPARRVYLSRFPMLLGSLALAWGGA